MKRTFVYAICLTLVASLMLGASVPALAKSERAALITELSGTVEVVKAGGSRKLVAFKDMPLNRGDHIETGSNSSVVLELADTGDQVTIEANSSLYISELSDEGDGKKSKIKMWAGSLWSKVKTLAGAEDEYEIETPTAVMGVRGTHLLVSVDPESGDALFFLGSGVAQVGLQDGNLVVLPPAQQLKLYNDGSDQSNNVVSYVSLDEFVSTAGPRVIQAILENMSDIVKENEQLIQQFRDQLSDGSSPTQAGGEGGLQTPINLDEYASNLEQLIGNIALSAVHNNMITREQVEQLIEKANRESGKNVNLDAVQPFKLTGAEQEKLNRLQQQQEQRRQQLEAARQQKEDVKQSQQELLKRLEEQRQKQQEENKKAAEEMKKQAEEKLKQQLANDATALNRFLEEKTKRDEEQVNQQQGRQPAQPEAPVTNPDSPNNPNNPSNPGGAKPKVTFTSEKVQSEQFEYAQLQVDLSNFTGANAIRGIQMHLLMQDAVQTAYDYSEEPTDYPTAQFGGVFPSSERRYELFHYVDVDDHAALNEQIGYSDVEGTEGFHELLVVELNTGTAQSVSDSFFIRIPVFSFYTEEPLKLKLADLIIVKADGTRISASEMDIVNAPNGVITLPALQHEHSSPQI